MLALTVGLLIFAFPSTRRILYNFRSKNRTFFDNQIIQYGLYFSFAIIGLILLESVYTFSTLKTHFNERIHILSEIAAAFKTQIGRDTT
jgi:hypothetical protein